MTTVYNSENVNTKAILPVKFFRNEDPCLVHLLKTCFMSSSIFDWAAFDGFLSEWSNISYVEPWLYPLYSGLPSVVYTSVFKKRALNVHQ